MKNDILSSNVDKSLDENDSGYIYFITNKENIKIGFTSVTPQKRLKQLNAGSDKQLYLLGYQFGSMDDEKELHNRFQKFRIRDNAEWFYPDQSIIDYINQNNVVENCYVFVNEYMNNTVMSTLGLRRV